MEQLIILIIMLVLGSVFGKGKKNQPEKKGPQPKPFVVTKEDPMKRLKELSQDMYRELQKEFQQTSQEPPSRQTTIQSTPIAVEKVSEIFSEERVDARPTTQRRESRNHIERPQGRLSVHGGQKVQYEERVTEIVPKTKEDFLRGIIFSEILGPPKSKQ